MSLDKLSQIRKREQALQQKAKTHSEEYYRKTYDGLHDKRKLWNHNTKIEFIAHTSKD